MKVIEPTHKPGTLVPFYVQKAHSMPQRQVSQKNMNIKSLGLSVNMVNEQNKENQGSRTDRIYFFDFEVFKANPTIKKDYQFPILHDFLPF